MTASFLWALASMAGQGVNDLVFKRFTSGSRNLGTYFAGIGLVWAATLLLLDRQPLSLSRTTLLCGLVSGAFSVTANIALVRALRRLDAAIGVTIFRLNFVLVMWLAVPLLHEPMTAPKVVGLCAAALAVLLFTRDGRKGAASTPVTSLALAVTASLLRAGMGVTYKLAFLEGAEEGGFLLMNALCWLVGGVAWAALSERSLRLDRRTALYSLTSALLIVEIVVCLARAVAAAQASIVLPITQLSFLFTAVLAALLFRERLRGARLLALACGVAAVITLMRA